MPLKQDEIDRIGDWLQDREVELFASAPSFKEVRASIKKDLSLKVSTEKLKQIRKARGLRWRGRAPKMYHHPRRLRSVQWDALMQFTAKAKPPAHETDESWCCAGSASPLSRQFASDLSIERSSMTPSKSAKEAL